jgi:N-acetylmuramoyl-L-alanine amidase
MTSELSGDMADEQTDREIDDSSGGSNYGDETPQPEVKEESHPVGKGDYVVQQGDCISSIAYAHGFFPQTLWNHEDNSELKRCRKNPNVLLPGDRVTIPRRQEKQEAGATERRHRFRRKAIPERLRIRLLDEKGDPRKNLSYKLTIDGKVRQGKTDGRGLLNEPIAPNAREGVLVIGEGALADTFPLLLGHTDPVTTAAGVQKRLKNLGWNCGPEDGVLRHETRWAIEQFQSRHGLTVTGLLDDATREKLLEVHGS